MNKMMRLRICALFVVMALLLQPLAARASCYSGGTPDWSDVKRIQVTRCQPTNIAYPCYASVFAPYDDNGIDGYLIAARLTNRKGRFIVQRKNMPGAPWGQMIGLLRQAKFYNLEIPNPRPTGKTILIAHIDAPFNQITVVRCHTHLTIDADVVYDERSQGWARFIALMGDLNKLIETLPWEKKSDQATITDVDRYVLP